jgi:hypothetical protein
MPAPIGSQNALKHGLRSERALVLSDPPVGSLHIKRDATILRRKLEAAAVALYGPLTLPLESLINLACRAEVRYLLAAKWLRDPQAKLTPSEKLSMVNAMAEATSARDAAIQRLKLDTAPINGHAPDPWETAIRQADAMHTASNGKAPTETAATAEGPHNANGATPEASQQIDPDYD